MNSSIIASANTLALSVADHVSAMLAYWDNNLVCRFANAAYRDWFGKSQEEMIDKITIQELLGPLYEKNLPYIQGALKGKTQIFEREIKTPSGDIRYSIANYFPDIEHEEVKGFFVHVADITQIKLLENELKASNEVINEQNRRLLNFANTVSHNLRSHASNLSGMLALYEMAETQNQKDNIIDFIKNISTRLNQTLDNLNEIVRVHNTEIKLQVVNLHDCIARTIDLLKLQIQSAGAEIQNNVPASTNLYVNAAYLESIILNLLTNALKYKHPRRTPVVTFNTENTEGSLRLKIKDNGIGINLKKYRKDLFGMYKTFHGNADAQGVGLYITKFQIEAMQGKIDVESEEGQGTTFIVDFKR